MQDVYKNIQHFNGCLSYIHVQDACATVTNVLVVLSCFVETVIPLSSH